MDEGDEHGQLPQDGATLQAAAPHPAQENNQALTLAAYALGLSFRRTTQLFQGLGVQISHVAIWYWKERFAVNWQVWRGALPERIVVDETLVKVCRRASAGSSPPLIR